MTLIIHLENNCEVNTTKCHLTSITFVSIATKLWSTELVRFDVSVGVTDPEISLMAFQRSFMFVSCLPLQYTLLLMAHKFSTKFKSGLFEGQAIIRSLLKPAFLHYLAGKSWFSKETEAAPSTKARGTFKLRSLQLDSKSILTTVSTLKVQ